MAVLLAAGSVLFIHGLIIGLIFAAGSLIHYSVMPMPMPMPLSLAMKWPGFGILQCILLATVAEVVYGKDPIDQNVNQSVLNKS